MLGRFWAELKRRGVVRVVGAYVVVGVGVAGAAEVFLPNLGAPDWVLPTLLVLIILGLPAAAILSWAYDLTPDAGPPRSERSPSAAGSSTAGSLASAPDAGDGGAAAGSGESVALAGEARAAPSPKSIVVLPFANLSDDPGNEYFSDGVMEDILTYLTRVEDLHVISRTSAMVYKGSPASVRQIASELNVATVLEGSVRRAGDRVRVTAQLIDAGSDRHIWAENYDRALDDIFAVQSEVAQEIAGALHARLSPQELSEIREIHPAAMETYELYVKGRQAVWTIQPHEILRGIGMLEEATERDPRLAGAMGTLAFGYMISAYWAGATPRPAFEKSSRMARRALSVDPRNPTAWGALGAVLGHLDYDWDGSADAMNKAVEYGPNDRDAHFFQGVNLLTKGRFRDAIRGYERAAELDPLDPLMAAHLATAVWCAGDEARAEEIFTRVFAEHPNFADAHGLRAMALARDGRWAELATTSHTAAQLTGMHPIYRAREALGLSRSGRVEEAKALVADVREADLSSLSNARAVAALADGDMDLALRELAVAVEERQPMVMWMRIGRFFDESDPRVRACLQPVWEGRWGEEG